MRFLSSFIVILLCFIYGCDKAEYELEVSDISPKEISFTRTTSGNNPFPTGGEALFNAKGAIEIDSKILTYQGGKWDGIGRLEWNNEYDEASLTILHPVYPNKLYTTENIYKESLLEDILIVKDTLHEPQEINLEFNHLFSKLTIEVNKSLQKDLKELRLSVPVTITEVDPISGSIVTAEEEQVQTLPADSSESYSFIIPPMNDASLILTTIVGEKTYSTQLSVQTYRSGIEYACRLLKEGGIYNVQDLIDFSKLINGENVTGRTLEEFYNVIDGDTVIFLKEDLTLNADNSKQILPIGYHNTKGFRHTFDGQGHTISGLVVPDKSTNNKVNNGYSGLFGYITEDGIVRNLTIEGASNVKNAISDGTGVLAAQNYGLIIDCTILSSTLEFKNNDVDVKKAGFICAQNLGKVINCHVKDCTLSIDQYFQAGFITGVLKGKILNCRSFNNYFSMNKTTSVYIGGIAGYSSNEVSSSIVNCYIYTVAKDNRDHFGSVIGYAQKGIVRNAFYNIGKAYYREPVNTDFINTAIATLDNDYLYNDTLITDHFHNWIDTKGKENYPDIEFKRWIIPEGKYPKFDE